MEAENWLPAIAMAVITMLCVWGLVAHYSVEQVDLPDVKVDMSEVISAINALETSGMSEAQIDLITSRIIAEFPEVTDLDNAQVKDMWDRIYSEEIEALENSSLLAVEDELEEDADDDYEGLIEFLEEALGISIDDDEDEFKVYNIDDDDTEVKIINLGLEDADDREVNVHVEFKVRYEDVDTDTTHKDRVSVDAVITYDDGEPEVELVYSL